MRGCPFNYARPNGEPHGEMEPVENVLGARRHVRRQVPDRVAAIGQERDVLIHLQALFAQDLMQASLWLVVEAQVPRT